MQKMHVYMQIRGTNSTRYKYIYKVYIQSVYVPVLSNPPTIRCRPNFYGLRMAQLTKDQV